MIKKPTNLVSTVTFTHGGNPWWGVTTFNGTLVEKVMFSTKDSAESWMIKRGIKKPSGGHAWRHNERDQFQYYTIWT